MEIQALMELCFSQWQLTLVIMATTWTDARIVHVKAMQHGLEMNLNVKVRLCLASIYYVIIKYVIFFQLLTVDFLESQAMVKWRLLKSPLSQKLTMPAIVGIL